MKKLLLLLPIPFLWFPNVSHAALTTNLVSYWKLDGNSNDAVGTNNGTDTSVLYNTSYGKINQGINVNNGNINVGTGLNAFSSAISISLWVYQTGYPASGYGLAFNKFTNTAPYGGYCINNGASTDQNWYFQLNLGGSLKGTSAVTPTLNAWTHLVGTYDGTTMILYKNGVPAGTLSTTGTINYQNSAQSVLIGQNGGSGAEFIGYIDEIGIWSRALTPTEVTQLYNGGAGLQYPFTTTPLAHILAPILQVRWWF